MTESENLVSKSIDIDKNDYEYTEFRHWLYGTNESVLVRFALFLFLAPLKEDIKSGKLTMELINAGFQGKPYSHRVYLIPSIAKEIDYLEKEFSCGFTVFVRYAYHRLIEGLKNGDVKIYEVFIEQSRIYYKEYQRQKLLGILSSYSDLLP